MADLDPDPIVQFKRWFDDVVAAQLSHPTAMALATADGAGRPSVRHVLLKGVDDEGFSWFTNYESRKGQELAANPHASGVFPWFPIGRQVVVFGPVARVSADESDEYFATRDRGSQIGAWASPQSEPIPDRAWLEARAAEIEARFGTGPVPRPPHWGGFRLRPEAIDFWANRENRLHDRFRYERAATGWAITRLAP